MKQNPEQLSVSGAYCEEHCSVKVNMASNTGEKKKKVLDRTLTLNGTKHFINAVGQH